MKHENILLKSALALAIVDLVLIVAILLQVNNLVKDVLEVQNRQIEIEVMKERLERAEEARKQEIKIEEKEAPKLDTSQWPVYRNTDYGLEIRYPKNWFLADFTTIKPAFSPATFVIATISNKDLGGLSYSYSEPYLVIYAFQKSEKEKLNLTLEGLKHAHGHHYPDSIIDIIDLNGKLALKEKSRTSDNFSIIILGDDNFYGIEYFAQGKNEYSNIYNHIANTLRLSDGRFSITDNPQKSGWKIYSNQKYQYQMEFPNDWTVAGATVSNLHLTKGNITFAFSLPPLGFGFNERDAVKVLEVTLKTDIIAKRLEFQGGVVVELQLANEKGLIKFDFDKNVSKEENLKVLDQILLTLKR